jgi:hypothetical protein
MQWVHHLRMLGFQFYVLPRVFLMHIPHAKSATRKVWQEQSGTKPSKALFDAFKAEVSKKRDAHALDICGDDQRLSRRGQPQRLNRMALRRRKRLSDDIVPIGYNAILAGTHERHWRMDLSSHASWPRRD